MDSPDYHDTVYADEEVGMAAGENQGELASIGQVLEFVEREDAEGGRLRRCSGEKRD